MVKAACFDLLVTSPTARVELVTKSGQASDVTYDGLILLKEEFMFDPNVAPFCPFALARG